MAWRLGDLPPHDQILDLSSAKAISRTVVATKALDVFPLPAPGRVIHERQQRWHTDRAMKPLPATYSYFYARKVSASPAKDIPDECVSGSLPRKAGSAKGELRQEIKAEIDGLETRMVRWIVGTVITMTALAFAIGRFVL